MATAVSAVHEPLIAPGPWQVLVIEAAPGAARRQLLEESLGRYAEAGARTFMVSTAFETGGPWAGVSGVFTALYPEIRDRQPELVERHSLELVYVMPQLRRSVTVRNPNLTDMAPVEEKSRNYAADRAFRNVHGLIDLLDRCKSLNGPEDLWVIACDHFDQAGVISSRFFRELMRRRGKLIRLVVAADPGGGERIQSAFGPALKVERQKIELAGDQPPAVVPEQAERMALELEQAVAGDWIEMQIQLPDLLRLWSLAARQDKLLYYRHFGLYIYNTLGLYEDALRYGEGLLELAAAQKLGDEQRWSIMFKLLMCYMGLQNSEDSLKLAEGEAMKLVENGHTAWRGQLCYLIAMLYARYRKPRDLAKGEEYLDLGLAAMEQSDLPEGAKHFQCVFNRNGLAMVRNFQGRFQEAIELCRSGIERLNTHLSAGQHRLHRSVLLYNIAQVYFAIGSHAEAIEYYSAAMAMDPNYSEYYNERGNIFLQLGRLEEAHADYLRAIELSPPYFEVFTNLGQCCRRMGAMEDAEEAYTRALDLQPDDLLALLGRAKAREELGNADAALADYSAALARDSTLWEAAASRGILLYQAGDLQDALLDFDRAIELKVDQADLYQNRAVILAELLRHDDAIRDIRKALTLNPDEADRTALEERLQAELLALERCKVPEAV